MKIASPRNCKCCTAIDLIEHLFLQCSKVKPQWNEIPKDLNAFLVRYVALDVKLVLGWIFESARCQ